MSNKGYPHNGSLGIKSYHQLFNLCKTCLIMLWIRKKRRKIYPHNFESDKKREMEQPEVLGKIAAGSQD